MSSRVLIIGILIIIILPAFTCSFAGDDIQPAVLLNNIQEDVEETAPFYGSKVVYAVEDGLYCVNLDDEKATLLVKGSGISNPVFSSDGNAVSFIQSRTLYAYVFKTSKARILAAISKRQIYMYMDSSLLSLTKDYAYRSEAPIFLKDNNHIVFVRQKSDSRKSVWIMDSDGKKQTLLAIWKYSNANDDRSVDFYGRIDWSNMFTVFDNSKNSAMTLQIK